MLYVVIPVYNAKEYLQTAVDSVLEQPSKDIKVVLVDDGSTDGSGDLCDAIAKKCKNGGYIQSIKKMREFRRPAMPELNMFFPLRYLTITLLSLMQTMCGQLTFLMK